MSTHKDRNNRFFQIFSHGHLGKDNPEVSIIHPSLESKRAHDQLGDFRMDFTPAQAEKIAQKLLQVAKNAKKGQFEH